MMLDILDLTQSIMAYFRIKQHTSGHVEERGLKAVRLHKKPRPTIEKVILGGIGSFFLVVLFPHGVRYFFRNMFAEIVSAAVTIILAGLLTQKLAEKITENGSEAKR